MKGFLIKASEFFSDFVHFSSAAIAFPVEESKFRHIEERSAARADRKPISRDRREQLGTLFLDFDELQQASNKSIKTFRQNTQDSDCLPASFPQCISPLPYLVKLN